MSNEETLIDELRELIQSSLSKESSREDLHKKVWEIVESRVYDELVRLNTLKVYHTSSFVAKERTAQTEAFRSPYARQPLCAVTDQTRV